MSTSSKIHIVTIVTVFSFFFLIFPDFSSDLSNYRKETDVLSSVEIHPVKDNRGNRRDILVLITQSGFDWYIESKYSDFWPRLQNVDNISKKIVAYRSNVEVQRFNPVQVEIDGYVIYDVHENDNMHYGFLLVALCCSFYSGYKLWELIVKYY